MMKEMLISGLKQTLVEVFQKYIESAVGHCFYYLFSQSLKITLVIKTECCRMGSAMSEVK